MTGVEKGTLVVALLLGVAWYLSYSAARLDRLHARVEGTLAALDAQLVRRAEATLELVNSGALDAASALILAGAASESLATTDQHASGRETVESDLSEALGVALTPDVLAHLREDGTVVQDVLDRVHAAGTRVQLARRFHNDAVIDVRRVRRKASTRLFRLAGHAELPRTFEFDDELPPGLRE
ncbi:MAG: hypothetical protein ACR2JN_01455 [Lapillicoccus sp.]